ncbi:hypothetical protein [uncultured Limimaricola sp.]|uniref:hypothetical protein n=1 Tax=uncultured Limimaricola sp. TaxID=2211667 RepID=UPI0030F98C30
MQAQILHHEGFDPRGGPDADKHGAGENEEKADIQKLLQQSQLGPRQTQRAIHGRKNPSGGRDFEGRREKARNLPRKND